jgi:multidrug efflux system outer membrane protein
MLMADPRNPLPRRLRPATVNRSDAGRPALLLRATRWSLSILRLTLIALVLPLSACSSVLTDSRAAMDGVPAHWQAEALDTPDAAGGAAATPTDLAAWWLRFNDAALSDWTRRAREGNPRALVAEAAWRQAVAQRDVAAAARWPSLGADASASRSTRGDAPGEERVQLGLAARWVPDVFGGAGRALAAAEAVVRARRASWGDVQVQLAAEAALAYIDLRADQRKLALAQDTLASQRQTLQITDWRQQAGLISTLEVEQARAAAAQTEALLPALRTVIAQRRHALALLAGEPYLDADADGAAAEVEPGSVPTAPASLVLEIPAETLRQRADVRAAELEVAAALARVGQAEAQRWPSFALSGSIGLNALTLGALGDAASRVSSLLASVSLPLVDGGARRAQVRVQQAALDQARAQHRATVLGALKDVEDALVALQGDRSRLTALRRAAVSAGRAAVLAEQRFSGGLVDFQTVLQTQRTAFSARDAELGARADLARDHVELYRALGGGWRAAPALAAQAPGR